jgi:VIT1/CCC1 family predicted Fe2+/Mn2+ transporter
MPSSSLGFIRGERCESVRVKVVESQQPSTRTGFRDVIRPAVLGSLDGLITSFVIIVGGIAGHVSKRSVIVIGFASLFGDAFSMGASEFLSSRTETTTRQSIYRSIACFVSFCTLGCIQLLSYIWDTTYELVVCSSVFFLCLLLISSFQSRVSTCHCRKTLEIVILGTLAGSIAYGTASLSQAFS